MTGDLRILSIHEPYATLAALLLVKRHETRGWRTTYRGPLLIHAAKVWGRRQRREWTRLAEALEEFGVVFPSAPSLGMVLGRCVVASCRPTQDTASPLFPDEAVPFDEPDRLCGDWEPGRFAIGLEGMMSLPSPIPWVGSQGRPRLVPPMLSEAVTAQLGDVAADPAGSA